MRLQSDENWENRLGDALMALDKPTIPASSQEKLRLKLIRKITSTRYERELSEMLPWYYMLISAIKKIGHETIPSSSMRVLLKEKILALLPQQRGFSFAFLRIFSSKAVSFALLFVFVCTALFGFFNSPEKVAASPITYIENFEGQVEIIRNGKLLQVDQKIPLRDEDIIKTDKDSSATIHFLDDSLGRLSEGSELQIERLFVNPFDKTKTIVEVQLKKGRMWANVLSLVDEFSSFQVRGNETVTVAKKKATFDVSIDEKGKTKISAMSNAVDVKVAQSEVSKPILSTTLVNGYTVEVDAGKQKAKSQIKEDTGDKDSWTTENIAADQQYVQQITERDRETRMETVGGFNPVKMISDTTSKVFKSDFEKEKARLKAAEAKLVQAELLLEQDNHAGAESLFNDFNSLSAETAMKIKELEISDPEEAAALKDAYETQLSLYKKQFTLFLPDDKNYALKKVVENAEFNLATTPVEKVEAAFDIAGEKILETQQLAKSGKDDLAQASLEEYTKAVENASSVDSGMSNEEKEQVISAVLDKKADHLVMLQALAKEVELKEMPVLAPTEQRGISFEEVIGKAANASLPVVSDPSPEMLKKIEQVQQVEVNGKPVLDVKQSSGTVVVAPVSIDQVLEKVETPNEIKTDPLSGITVITIEAKPTQANQEDLGSQE